MAKAATKKPGTEVIDWEAEMERQASIAAGQQRATGGGGKFFSMQAGVLSFDGNPMPGNRMAVVILGDVLENSWYDGPYDPSTPASPKCFAFAKEEADLEPHTAVDNDSYFERQNDVCNGCPQNEWGSAATGKGKACKNVQRLVMIPAGSFTEVGKGRDKKLEFGGIIEDDDHYESAEAAFMKLPVMSVKNYGAYVKELNANLRRPPHGVVTEIWVEPDPKSQFKVMFEVIDKVPSSALGVIMARHTKEQAALDFPYSPPMAPDEAVPAKAANKLKTRAKK